MIINYSINIFGIIRCSIYTTDALSRRPDYQSEMEGENETQLLREDQISGEGPMDLCALNLEETISSPHVAFEFNPAKDWPLFTFLQARYCRNQRQRYTSNINGNHYHMTKYRKHVFFSK